MTTKSGFEVWIGEIGEGIPADLPTPFATLVPAFSERECQRVTALASALRVAGCVQFCCVGPQAEHLHDALDTMFENASEPPLTAWDTCAQYAFQYFVFAAGGLGLGLLALLSSHEELIQELAQTMPEA